MLSPKVAGFYAATRKHHAPLNGRLLRRRVHAEEFADKTSHLIILVVSIGDVPIIVEKGGAALLALSR
ncbi:MAG: hypothetical protein FJX40_16140 [Alphaproteobacteria bacterium]|nr:hypothetical protein [Alphaproteobacteria bacterium]